MLNGTVTTAWPSMGVVSDDTRSLMFGGTLIAPNMVLTSAYVAQQLVLAGGGTSLGLYLSSAGLQYVISKITSHSSWSSGSEHNIALLELNTDINTITPAIVKKFAPVTLDAIRFVGYGPDLIKRTGVDAIGTVSPTYADWTYNTGEPTASTGDLGSGIFDANGAIIGVATTICTTDSDVGVFTRADVYNSWIAATAYAPASPAEPTEGMTCTYDNPEYDPLAGSGPASIETYDRLVTWRVFYAACPKVNLLCSSTSYGYVAAATVCQQALWS